MRRKSDKPRLAELIGTRRNAGKRSSIAFELAHRRLQVVLLAKIVDQPEGSFGILTLSGSTRLALLPCGQTNNLVEEVHRHRILLDVGGHTGERTSFDALEMSSGVPIVCTHTNFAGLNPNMRAISDRMAEAIARTGGVIGITAVSAFHVHNAETQDRERDRQATLDEHLDQYDYAKRLLGAEHVGLGPDFIWGWGPSMPMDPEDSAAFPPWSMAPGLQSTVEGFEDTSKVPNLIAGLEARGWTEEELDLLLGGNWLRVYEQVWGE